MKEMVAIFKGGWEGAGVVDVVHVRKVPIIHWLYDIVLIFIYVHNKILLIGTYLLSWPMMYIYMYISGGR